MTTKKGTDVIGEEQGLVNRLGGNQCCASVFVNYDGSFANNSSHTPSTESLFDDESILTTYESFKMITIPEQQILQVQEWLLIEPTERTQLLQNEDLERSRGVCKYC